MMAPVNSPPVARPRSCRRTLGARDAAAAIGVEDPDRDAADRRRRKITHALFQARPDLSRPGRVRSIPLAGGPEERPVLPDRPAECAAIQPVVRVGQSALGLGLALFLDEEVFADAPHRTGLIEARAVKGVGARLRRDVEHAAARAAHLGVVGMDLNLTSSTASIVGFSTARPTSSVIGTPSRR